MIARLWRGVTRAADADRYVEYLNATGVTNYGATEGNQGVFVFRRGCRRDGRAIWTINLRRAF